MSLSHPQISIIIPSYNHALFIEEAVQSVLNQSFEDFELLIIDDASTDNSWELIQAIDDPRISIIQHKENQGAAPTINEGLQLAKGKYLTILNSDDSYHPERLERLHTLNGDFITSDLCLLDEHSQPKESSESAWVNWFENLKSTYKESGDFLATLLQGNFLITTSNFFFSRKVYEQLQGFKDYRYIHDYEFALEALLTGFKVEYCQEKLLNYRLHESNTIRESPLKAIQENTQFLLSLLEKHQLTFTKNPHYLSSLNQHLTLLYQYTNEEWSSLLHYKLVNKEEALFELIKDRDNWISERDENIESLNHKVEETIHNYLRISTDLEVQQQINNKQTKWIKDRNAWIDDRNLWISERDQIIKNQQEWIQDRDRWIQERDLTIQHLQGDIKQLRDSHSYRLGRKLIALLQPLKRIIKKEHYA